MWTRLTCDSFGNVISSPASADGPTQADLPAGPMIARCGPEAAPASHSAAHPLDAANDSRTPATFGLSGSGSSELAALLPSLANRLPAPLIGSLRSKLTWKVLDIGLGLRISRLARSGLTTYGREFGFLATPTATANQGAPSMRKHKGCRGIEVSPQAWCKRMGYPLEWLAAAPCADSATPSSRKSRRK